MSDSMPGQFAKGSVLAEAERVLTDPSVRHFIESSVHNGQTLAAIIKEDQKVGFHGALADHLIQHVLDETSSKNYWPDQDHKDAILREGLRKCILEAQAGSLPIQLGWVCAGGTFQFVAMKSDAQVTGLILSPPLPDGIIDMPTPIAEPFWVVAESEYAKQIVEDGSGPVWDPENPGETRPRTEEEKPILTASGSPDVHLVQLRRSKPPGSS